MATTARFQRQHQEIMAIAGDFRATLDARTLGRSAQVARNLLSDLVGKLKIHLAMEDKSLYPRLLRSPDPEVRGLAERFMAEMGGIASVLVSYLGAWPTAQSIQDEPYEFVRDSKGLLKALAARVEKEERLLYPAVDNAA